MPMYKKTTVSAKVASVAKICSDATWAVGALQFLQFVFDGPRGVGTNLCDLGHLGRNGGLFVHGHGCLYGTV